MVADDPNVSPRAFPGAGFLLILAGTGAASAQLLDRLFGNEDQQQQPAAGAGPDGAVRSGVWASGSNRLEGQIRQLTGAVEQLTFRNQQLEQQLQRQQQDTEFRFEELSGKGRPQRWPTGRPPAYRPTASADRRRRRRARAGTRPARSPRPASPAGAPMSFDPNQRPDCARRRRARSARPASRSAPPSWRSCNPQAPRAGSSTIPSRWSARPAAGRPARRSISGSMAAPTPPTIRPSLRRERAARSDGRLPAPPPRNSSATGQPVGAPWRRPSNTPKDRVRPRLQATCSARTMRWPSKASATS